MSIEGPAARAGAQPEQVDLIQQEQALWRDLGAASEAAFGEAWLALMVRLVPGVSGGVLLLPRAADAMAPVAAFPPERIGDAELIAAARLAVEQRRGVAQPPPPGASKSTRLAYPIFDGEVLVGAAAVAFDPLGLAETRRCMRMLQWSAAWVRDFSHRRHSGAEAVRSERLSLALDLLAAALEEAKFTAAARIAATELASRLQCARVSFGFLRRGRCHVETISHSAQFGKQMNLVKLLAAAMDEAVDQQAVVCHPPLGPDDPVLTRAHAELASAHGAAQALTVPLFVKDHFVGAACFERAAGAPFDQESVDLAETVVSILGPALEDKREKDRWLIVRAGASLAAGLQALLGAGHYRLKLAVLALAAAVAFGCFAKGEYRIVADGKVEGAEQRAVVAPFDGYISEAPARAGDSIKQGDLIAALNDRDLLLERLKWATERQQHLFEYDKDLSGGDRAEAKRHKAQLDEAEAQMRLVDEVLRRSRMIAPFDGLILSGDLSQSIGAAVRRGDTLFRLAPLADYRVELMISETQIAEVQPGQMGELIVAALPDAIFRFRVERITPVAVAREGVNQFAVDGLLLDNSPRLRPGMDGVGKIDDGERRLVWIWTRALIHSARIALWSWLP
jgi:multidrug efflux pump subunit AcrA (membrane-fusion protein)